MQGFLDIGGAWDPSLALVMGGRVRRSASFSMGIRRGNPDRRVSAPIDGKLLLEALFGVGWGVCPDIVRGLHWSSLSAAVRLPWVMWPRWRMIVAGRLGSSDRSGAAPGFQVMDSGRCALRIAINGYGGIGRCFLRALTESVSRPNFVVVAINDPADLASIAYLTRYDSTHGRFPGR